VKLAHLVVLLVACAVSCVLAQTAAEKEVLQFERDACKGFLNADKAALERDLERVERRLPMR